MHTFTRRRPALGEQFEVPCSATPRLSRSSRGSNQQPWGDQPALLLSCRRPVVSSRGPTWAPGAALSRRSHGSGARGRRAGRAHTRHRSLDARAALAGVGGGAEGVPVGVHAALVEAGVARGTAALRRDGVGTLEGTGPPLTGHLRVLGG